MISDAKQVPAPESPAPVEKAKLPGNRKNRRGLTAIAKRINSRPGTGYNKRSAQGPNSPKTGWHKRLIVEMRDNAQVIENVLSGSLDKYL